MALLALIYPELKAKDYEWIQSLREKYDQDDFNVIGPHFTLVFPVDGVAHEAFVEHVRTISRRSTAFTFEVRCAIVVLNKWNEQWYLFLAPDKGYSRFVQLHTDLYTGPLADKARFDEPYIPHITIGKFDALERCRDIADALNAKHIRIDGSVKTIDIVDYTGGTTTAVDRFELRPD